MIGMDNKINKEVDDIMRIAGVKFENHNESINESVAVDEKTSKRRAGFYNVITKEDKELDINQYHDDMNFDLKDLKDGWVRYGVDKVFGKLLLYFSAYNKEFAYKAMKYIDKKYDFLTFDRYEIELITDPDSDPIYIHYDENKKLIREAYLHSMNNVSRLLEAKFYYVNDDGCLEFDEYKE